METTNLMVQKILSDIELAFRKEPFIDEFDIIPMPDDMQCNKSPVIHIDRKLGLESWCMKHVFRYCYNHVFVNRFKSNNNDFEKSSSMVKIMLLILPDVQSLWNLRKTWVEAKLLNLEKELYLSELVLTRKAKCSEAFNQRKWLHEHRFRSGTIVDADKDNNYNEAVMKEIDVCNAAANRYSNNYHAWSHRIWMVQKFAKSNRSILLSELKRSENWCRNHVSDHSGLHYRQFIIGELSKLDTCQPDCHHRRLCPKLLLSEIDLCNDFILTFSGHESLWNHRRFILFNLPNFTSSACRNQTGNLNQEIKRSKLEIPHVCEQSYYSLEDENKFLALASERNNHDDCELNFIEKHREWMSTFCFKS